MPTAPPRPDSAPLRAGIVGTGGIAAAHARALRAHRDDVELAGVADLDRGRAEEFGREHEAAAVAGSLQELLASGDGLDVVHVCTPPGTHVALAAEALASGVHVLLEKPPALSLADFDRLVAAQDAAPADRRGRHARAGVVFQHRFGAAAERLRRWLGDGTLGRSLLATCHTQWYRPPSYFETPWRGTWDAEGGGPTMGHGIHQVDLLLSVLGPWREVRAVAARQARDVDTEDVSMALVTMADGTLVSVVNSLLSPRESSELRFDTEHATVELHHLYGHGESDWRLTAAPGHEELTTRWADEAGRSARDTVDPVDPVDDADPAEAAGAEVDRTSHRGQVGRALAAIRTGGPLPVPLPDARRTLELSAAIYASAFTDRTVRAGEIAPGHAFYDRMDGDGTPWPAAGADGTSSRP
ncbi:Gfo/Idh/MocA family protein [Ornithinicoccus halotolerans]|uniref:Gfo/Idh/MocA family protein n=1 Tax=Ornithinicoccus halotolerans TaxID=1748220 RepID=UPI001297C9E3|nr:Gfo/Idh/MocA family oxidoreductase [Ornithinicoccus halotolerans]